MGSAGGMVSTACGSAGSMRGQQRTSMKLPQGQMAVVVSVSALPGLPYRRDQSLDVGGQASVARLAQRKRAPVTAVVLA